MQETHWVVVCVDQNPCGPGGHLACPLSQGGGGDEGGYGPLDDILHCRGQSPTPRIIDLQTLSSARAEKPWCRQMV